jgi:hypothetical protein
MTDPAKLCEKVRTLAIRAYRLVKPTMNPGPGREEIDDLLKDIDLLNQMIVDSRLHHTDLAAWVRNLRSEVARRAIPG